MKTLINNPKGFSLVQVMVSVGIMGGMALMMMKMSDNQIKQQKGMDLKAEQGDLANIIRSTIRDKEACEATFLGMSPGDEIPEIRMNPDLSKPAFAVAGEKFKNFNVYIKKMYLLTRAEELTFGLRPAGSTPIENYQTGAGFGYLRVTFVKQIGKITDSNTSHNFVGSKETAITFPVKGFFYDTEIVKHNQSSMLDQACWARASGQGITCNGTAGERCKTTPLDEESWFKGSTDCPDASNLDCWVDRITDAATATKLYLADCKYFRDNSPFMACADI
jgi:hypothetical protein